MAMPVSWFSTRGRITAEVFTGMLLLSLDAAALQQFGFPIPLTAVFEFRSKVCEWTTNLSRSERNRMGTQTLLGLRSLGLRVL
jgi:hypothetical protein